MLNGVSGTFSDVQLQRPKELNGVLLSRKLLYTETPLTAINAIFRTGNRR